MNFDNLTTIFKQTHEHLYVNAVRAVNVNLTLRNWLFGYYIVEFEQKGEDRARYGTALMSTLAKENAIKGLSETNLKMCRQFYLVYPQLQHIIFRDFQNQTCFLFELYPESLSSFEIQTSIRQTLSDELYNKYSY